ncbi:MAG: hypothetical protein M3Q93_12410 [Gemmatimonadota bacterium]|nr:hypothetical protein [Gemmatimonadota bacterium]
MRIVQRPWSLLLCSAVLLIGRAAPAVSQAGGGAAAPLPAGGYGSLTQNDLALRIQTPDLDVRFVPLDARVTRLLARDSWESLRSLVESRRAAIDSLANRSGVSRPGLALVTFHAQRTDARFDPQTLIVVVRNREFRPLAIVPFSGHFTSQQLDVREQVSGIYLYEEDLPVNDSFSLRYAGQRSDDWQGKQITLDRERARVALRARGGVRDTVQAGRVAVDSVAGDSIRARSAP